MIKQKENQANLAAEAAAKASAAVTSDAPAEPKEFPLKLRVYLDSFEDERTHEKHSYVAAELINPFPGYEDDFNNVRIAPRWDRDAALFKFRMNIYLKTHDDIILDGVCREVSYISKQPDRKGDQIIYPGIFFSLPYREGLTEFGFKKRKSTDFNGKTVFTDSGDSYIFRDLVSELWDAEYDPGADSSALAEVTDAE